MTAPSHTSASALQLAQACAASMYGQDRASQALGMRVLSIAPGCARLAMRVREDMVNGHGVCHGGLIFSLADSAFAFAGNTYNAVTVAAGASIEFLTPAHLGDELVADARMLSRSRRTGVYDVIVRNQRDECVALFRGRSRQRDAAIIAQPESPL